MTANADSVYDLVRPMELEGPDSATSWRLVLHDPADSAKLLPDLDEELEVQAQVRSLVVRASDLDSSALVNVLAKNRNTVMVVTGLDDWPEEEFVKLDLKRTSLQHSGPVLLEMTREGAERLMKAAPNLRSWIAGNVGGLLPDPGLMTDVERQARLASLAEHFGLTDAEVIRRAEDGSLPPDPQFVEWLILAGRGDLAVSRS
jgi:hypothetical protein